jgi:hypothetical protein
MDQMCGMCNQLRAMALGSKQQGFTRHHGQCIFPSLSCLVYTNLFICVAQCKALDAACQSVWSTEQERGQEPHLLCMAAMQRPTTSLWYFFASTLCLHACTAAQGRRPVDIVPEMGSLTASTGSAHAWRCSQRWGHRQCCAQVNTACKDAMDLMAMFEERGRLQHGAQHES